LPLAAAAARMDALAERDRALAGKRPISRSDA
jgi:hypothetical protein